jgi:DNA-binding NarL/FixJ family response regulator
MTKAINLAEPHVILEERSCSRCGSLFLGLGRQTLCGNCRKPKRSFEAKRGILGDKLTPREVQVGDLIADEGLANKIIAFRLHLTEGTVKVYVSTMLAKTGAGDRTKLCIWVREERCRRKKE